MPKTPETEENARRVAELADGSKSSGEIAAALGLNPRHVRKILLRLDLPRLPAHSPTGARNASFAGGRRIALDGYVYVSAPANHPHARLLPGKKIPRIREHRLVMEQRLGRHLLPLEIVDHADGLTLHNAPSNLRLFASNAEHLKSTLTGKVPRWSAAGHDNMFARHRPDVVIQRVDIHRLRIASGDVRLRQILLLALTLGTDSPYLLGTLPHTTKAGIDMSSRSTIERALADLCLKWGWVHVPSK
jgi:hypothetical protein